MQNRIMTFIFPSNDINASAKQNTLQKRRLKHSVNKLLSAFLAGFAVWAALNCICAGNRHENIAVAAKTIEKGQKIETSDVAIKQIPLSGWPNTVAKTAGEAEGKIAQTNIGKGEPLTGSLMSDMPVIPEDYTSADIAVASSVSLLKTGDKIMLQSAQSCETEAGAESEKSCLLSSNAYVLRIPDQSKSKSGSSFFSSDSSDASSTITVALPADDCLKVLKYSSNSAPIIAKTANRAS